MTAGCRSFYVGQECPAYRDVVEKMPIGCRFTVGNGLTAAGLSTAGTAERNFDRVITGRPTAGQQPCDGFSTVVDTPTTVAKPDQGKG